MKTFADTDELREALVELMKSRGINQLDVSRQSGVRQPVLSIFINRRERELRGNNALKIANFINASLPSNCPNYITSGDKIQQSAENTRESLATQPSTTNAEAAG